MKRKDWFTSVVLASMAGALIARYRRDIQAARERVASGGQQMVETACGPIEYLAGGHGLPVLVVHGAGGGYDQGRVTAQLARDAFHWIAMSRFGYLGTPVPADPSPKAQADAHAALLDVLNIPRAAIICISAGGPSALQFALRHSDRCSALVMVSAVSQAALPHYPLMDVVYKLLFRWDFVFWLMLNLARPVLISLLRIMPAVRARLTPAEEDWLSGFLDIVLPVSQRRAGLLLDMTLIPSLPRYPLERITAPTLVIHAADDSLIPFAQGEFTARSIPNAQLVTVPDGGHLLLGWQEEIGARVAEFLRQHARVGTWPSL